MDAFHATVRASGLIKSYGVGPASARVLNDVDVVVGRGEMLAVAGPSGAGKSTLLNCLSGLCLPDAGQIVVNGVDLASLNDDGRTDLRAAAFGFVFQSGNLIPSLTVAENVQLPLVLRGDSAADTRERSRVLLEQVHMSDKASSFPANLSGGEQQRVAIARALSTEPQIIWADEPTGALDHASGAEVIAMLRSAAQGERSVVVVTHDSQVAAQADRVLTMSDGSLSRDGQHSER